ncbi:MAG: contact-dependent growth inhibition system immunity protein [Phycisphaerales bacterium]
MPIKPGSPFASSDTATDPTEYAVHPQCDTHGDAAMSTDDHAARVKEFLSTYFHQDWRLDGTVGDVVALYREGESQEGLRSLADSLDVVAEQIKGEPASVLWKTFYCQYDPTVHRQTASQWLRELAQMLRTPPDQA